MRLRGRGWLLGSSLAHCIGAIRHSLLPPPPRANRAVLEAARALRAQEEAREARRARIGELLAAEGLQAHAYLGESYARDGVGSEEDVLAAARAAAAAAAARAARRARMNELLASEGLQQFMHTPAVYRFTQQGEGSEEAALAGARAAGAAQAARQAREATVTAALAAEGIDYEAVESAAALAGFVCNGIGAQEDGGCFGAAGGGLAGARLAGAALDAQQQGSVLQDAATGKGLNLQTALCPPLHAALAAARAEHERLQLKAQRREQMTALMTEAGLSLPEWEWRVPGLRGFLLTGTGSAEALVAQARAMSQPAPAGIQAYAV